MGSVYNMSKVIVSSPGALFPLVCRMASFISCWVMCPRCISMQRPAFSVTARFPWVRFTQRLFEVFCPPAGQRQEASGLLAVT